MTKHRKKNRHEKIDSRKVSEGGGGGVLWDPKACVPKMARSNCPYEKFRFFALRSLWLGVGGGGGASSPFPPIVYGHSNTSQAWHTCRWSNRKSSGRSAWHVFCLPQPYTLHQDMRRCVSHFTDSMVTIYPPDDPPQAQNKQRTGLG